MKNRGFRKGLKYLGIGSAAFFAIIGLALTTAFFAVKFHMTNDPGVVDLNDRYFQEIKDKYGKGFEADSKTASYNEAKFLNDLSVLSKYYPTNAFFIQNAYFKSRNLKEAQRMLQAVNLYMQDNAAYHEEINKYEVTKNPQAGEINTKSVFEWMNIP